MTRPLVRNVSRSSFAVLLAITIISATGWLATAPAWSQSKDAAWQELFNGKNLKGWKANMDPVNFTVENGLLKAHGKKGMSHLFFVGDEAKYKSFKNFELEAVVRGKPNSNSGIFFHTNFELRKKRYLNVGYEVQLNSTKKEKSKTGSLYAIVDLDQSPVDETKWFTIRIRVEGKRIRTWINDKSVLDYSEPNKPKRPASRAHRLISPTGGAIALQAHDPKSIFYFKRIRIRELAT